MLTSSKKGNKSVSVVFLCPYPLGSAPSQRFRYEQYLPLLAKSGMSYEVYSFLDERTWQILYRRGNTFQKARGLLLGFFRRISHLYHSRRADIIFIHREATPLGPPWVEWWLANIFRRAIVYDFDDAIWLADRSSVNTGADLIKWRRKVPQICRWSHRVSAGNAYLASFAGEHTRRVTVNPTTIDTVYCHNRLQQQTSPRPAIGWTGSHSTLKYLERLVPVLQQLERAHTFRLVVIANRPPEWSLASLDFIPWQQATEIDDLLRIHIGLMPLPDDRWAQGKCGFKALQYMALGIPALVSPVGVNAEIIEHGVEGFHCTTDEDWYQYLSALLTDAAQRKRMGRAGRKKVEAQYSVRSNAANFLSLFTN